MDGLDGRTSCRHSVSYARFVVTTLQSSRVMCRKTTELAISCDAVKYCRTDSWRQAMPADQRIRSEFVSDVKSSRPDCPRGRNFVLGLGLDKLSSASSSGIWPRHVLRLCSLASSICVFHDKAQANDLHSTIRSEMQEL